MAVDFTRARSRRALLAGVLGGAAAAVASVARPLAAAATDESVRFSNDENNSVVVYSISGESVPGTGAGIAMYGYSYHNTGVYGESLDEIGVRGDSEFGRGAQFQGGKAQVRLVASSRRNHPASGAKGDLFVDRSGRLWFCKGGTTWKQIA